jgi:hypothetical protein
MPTPSLLIVPARFKSGKMYSQIPTSGAGDFTVTRATTATRVNASGLIESVASGIPRLDYFASGGTVGCPALLVEPAATNLAFNSQTWNSGNNWQLSEGSGRVTVATATSGTLAPDGLSTANAISPTSGNLQHYFYSNSSSPVTYTSGTVFTVSAFFKKGAGDSGRYIQLTTANSRFVGNPYANFDLELGTTLTVSGSVADSNRISRIQNYGNGWYRCSLTATANNSSPISNGTVVALLIADTNARLGAAFAGNTSDYIFGWGAQMETGSVATSYIPTTTASVTRNRDIIQVTGAVSGNIGQTEGTIYMEMQADAAGTGTAILTVGGGSSDNYLYLGKDSGVLRVRVRIGGAEPFNNGATALNGSVLKVAVAYQQSGNCAAYVNGSFLVSGTAGNFTAALTGIGFGDQVTFPITAISAILRVRAVALYTTRLTNAELATLTSP